MPGHLQADRVVVIDQAEANRIFNKGRYGKPLSGGALHLSLMEAAYLLESGRLDVEDGGGQLTWEDFVVRAVQAQPDFEIPYLVYRDLRERGYIVQPAPPFEAKLGAHLRLWPRGETMLKGPPAMWLRAVSERAPFALADLLRFSQGAAEHAGQALVALVDEESDLTYYDVGRAAPSGSVPERISARHEGVFLGDRTLVASPSARAELHGHEFYGHPVASALQISLVETLHLVQAGRLNVQDPETGKPLSSAALRKRARAVEPEVEVRLRVFGDLKRRALIVKTGFKFGTHFRAYESRPEEGHAPYLVQAVPRLFTSDWAAVARAVRLSHSVRKKFYFAAVSGAKVEFLAFGRFRP